MNKQCARDEIRKVLTETLNQGFSKFMEQVDLIAERAARKVVENCGCGHPEIPDDPETPIDLVPTGEFTGYSTGISDSPRHGHIDHPWIIPDQKYRGRINLLTGLQQKDGKKVLVSTFKRHHMHGNREVWYGSEKDPLFWSKPGLQISVVLNDGQFLRSIVNQSGSASSGDWYYPSGTIQGPISGGGVGAHWMGETTMSFAKPSMVFVGSDRTPTGAHSGRKDDSLKFYVKGRLGEAAYYHGLDGDRPAWLWWKKSHKEIQGPVVIVYKNKYHWVVRAEDIGKRIVSGRGVQNPLP